MQRYASTSLSRSPRADSRSRSRYQREGGGVPALGSGCPPTPPSTAALLGPIAPAWAEARGFQQGWPHVPWFNPLPYPGPSAVGLIGPSAGARCGGLESAPR